MPTVPRINSGNVQQQALRPQQNNPNVPLEAFGGGQSFERVQQASDKLGGTFIELVRAEKERVNKVVVEQADSETIKLKNNLFWDPENGAIGKKGREAFGTLEHYGKQFDEQTQKIEEGLADDEQRDLYRIRRAARKNELVEQLQKHTFAEGQQYHQEQIESSLSTHRDDAVLNMAEGGKITTSIEAQKKLIDELGAMQGLSSEGIQLKKKEVESQTHISIIRRKLDLNQDMDADKYYQENKDFIRPEDYRQIQSAIEDGSYRAKSQNASEDLFNKYRNNESAAYKAAMAIEDPKLQDETTQRLEHLFSRQNAMKNRQEDDLYIMAANKIEANPGMLPKDAVGVNLWNQLSPEKRRSLQAKTENPVNDGKAWLNFLEMNHDKLAKMNRSEFETQYWSRFDSSHKSKAEQMWTTAKGYSSDPSKAGQYKSLRSEDELLLSALGNAKVGGITGEDTFTDIKKDNTKVEIYSAFKKNADDRLSIFAQENGRPANYEEKKKIYDELMVKQAYVKNPFFDDKVPVAAMTEKQREKAYYPIQDIPKDARMRLIRKAQANYLIDPKLSADQAMYFHKKQIEQAYAKALMNGSTADILSPFKKE